MGLIESIKIFHNVFIIYYIVELKVLWILLDKLNENLLKHMMHFKVSCLLFSLILRASCHNLWYYRKVPEIVVDCWGSPRIWIVLSRIVNQNFPIYYLNTELICALLIFCAEPMTIFYKQHFVKIHKFIVGEYFQEIQKIETDDTFIANAKNCINNYLDPKVLEKKREIFMDFCKQCPFYFKI